jgi:hypothetical protein
MPLTALKINTQCARKRQWTFAGKPVQSRAVMKNNLVTTILNWVLAGSLVLTVWFCTMFFFRTRELRTDGALLQMEANKYQNNRNFMNLLLNDTVEYSKRNPDIDRVLESVGLKLNRPGAVAPSNAPAPKPAAK